METLTENAPASSHFLGLRGKNVLVTDGSSGIGQAIAVRFGEEGANVGINYLSILEEARETEEMVEAVQRCQRKVEDCGVETHLVQADVSNEGDVTRMTQSTIDELGGIDVLVNNAGIQIASPTHETEVDAFDKVMEVNLRGAFLCAREAIRHWLGEDKPGCIVNVSSVHQEIPKPKYVGYSCSKGGMQNLTRTLALEYADRSIRVNAIAPGATVTPINRAWVEDPEKRKQVEDHTPMGRAGNAEEMAAVAAFLCSKEAGYITGQTIYIDGGLTLYPDFRTAWSSE
ncbi:glucose 1-dehydrogenase [Salinibacter ruber]|uniref:glucose 1-dehydrogenase n=1 Tax=Salinibacter ruber TaxID=146919 RepID=UPI002167B006|nr:glucose 1-dehydrogenase [Salinibacter ruber]MCS3629265.1 glucose 1-dehydrogenase [Salinibacter ruber]MCS4146173.1 glucose 1-dehydrogenase [Salinibacter ruber]